MGLGGRIALGSVSEGLPEGLQEPAGRGTERNRTGRWSELREEEDPAGRDLLGPAYPRCWLRPFCVGTAPVLCTPPALSPSRSVTCMGRWESENSSNLPGVPQPMYLDQSLMQGSCSDSAVPSMKNVYCSLPWPTLRLERLTPGMRNMWASLLAALQSIRWLFGAEGSSCSSLCPGNWPGNAGSRKVPSSDGSLFPPGSRRC